MMDPEAREKLVAASLVLERRTGYDSIPTVEGFYQTEVWSDEEGGYVDSGVYHCPTPGCDWTAKDSVAMWRHVHFSKSHGPSWEGVRSDAAAIALAEADL